MRCTLTLMNNINPYTLSYIENIYFLRLKFQCRKFCFHASSKEEWTLDVHLCSEVKHIINSSDIITCLACYMNTLNTTCEVLVKKKKKNS